MLVALSFGVLRAQEAAETPVETVEPAVPAPSEIPETAAIPEPAPIPQASSILDPTGASPRTALRGSVRRDDAALPESARQVILDVGQRLEWSDNPDLEVDGEDRFTSRTTLQLGTFRRTRTDELFFSLGGDLELSDDGSEDNDLTDITNPNLGLGWRRDVGHARTGVSFDYREVDLDSTTGSFFNEDTSSIDFGTIDGGTRETANLRIDGAFGIDGPYGGSYALGQRQIRYSETEDEDLRDADQLTFDGDLFVVVDPRLTVGVEAGYSDFDEDGPGDLDTTTWRVGSFAEVLISPRLSGRFGLGWEEVEESGTRDSVEDGVVFDAVLTQELQSSVMTFGLISDLVPDGRREELRFGHSLELPRYDLSYSLGLSRVEGFDTEPLFGFAWSQDLPRGAVRVALEQRATTGRDNENLINSRAVFGYTQELTTRTGFDLEVSYIDRNDRSGLDEDSRRLDVDLVLRHQIVDDWDLTGGVSLVRLEEDGIADRDSNTIFIGLEKRFVWN